MSSAVGHDRTCPTAFNPPRFETRGPRATRGLCSRQIAIPDEEERITMTRAIVYTEFGGPEVLAVTEAPTPELRPAHLIVRVEAAGVNPIDAKLRAGRRGAASSSFTSRPRDFSRSSSTSRCAAASPAIPPPTTRVLR